MKNIEQKMMEGSVSLPDIISEIGIDNKLNMLEVVLAWADLDGAMGILLSAVMGWEMSEGAEKVRGMKTSDRFRQIYLVFRDSPNGEKAAKWIKRHKRIYEYLSFLRNRVTHANCLGVLKEKPNFIVFAAFEKHSDKKLVIDAIDTLEFAKAAKWARSMSINAQSLADKINPNLS